MTTARSAAIASVLLAASAARCGNDDREKHVLVEMAGIPEGTTALEITIQIRDADYVVHVFDEMDLDDAIGDDGTATFAISFDDRGDVVLAIAALGQDCVIAQAEASCPEGCDQVRATLTEVDPPRCEPDPELDAGVPDANDGRT